MKTIAFLFSPEMVEALGWTIIHSLWQGFFVLIGLAIILLLIRKYSSQIKYFISFIALTGVLIWSTYTFFVSYRYAQEKQVLKEKIVSSPDYIKTLLKENIAQKTDTIDTSGIINLKEIRTRALFQRNFPIICMIWLIGILVLIIRFSGGLIYSRKIRNFGLTPLPNEWLERIDKLALRLNLRRKVTSFFSPLAKIPMTLGIIKPVILFPATIFTGLTTREIEAIIAHELAHIMRNDYFFNIIQSVVEIIFFYHPAVWFISSKIRKERENSCDNIAIQATGDKVAFVKALASVQIQFWESQQLSMGFAGKKNNILQRIKRLQNNIAMKTNFIEGLIAMSLIIVGLALASFTHIENVRANEMVALSTPDSTTLVKKEHLNPADIDSIRTVMEANFQEHNKNGNSTDEIERMVEVALSEQDKEYSAEMMEEINRSIQEMDIEGIIREAMQEATAAMREASIEVNRAMSEVDKEEINRDMLEAQREIEEARREMEEDMRRDMANDGIDKEVIDASVKAAQAGLDVAAGVVSNLDIEGIVNAALSGVEATLDALSEIDFDSSDHYDANYEQEKQLRKIEREKEKIKQEQRELKQRMKELEKELKQMEKEK